MVEPNGRPCNLQGRANGAVVMVIVDTDVGDRVYLSTPGKEIKASRELSASKSVMFASFFAALEHVTSKVAPSSVEQGRRMFTIYELPEYNIIGNIPMGCTQIRWNEDVCTMLGISKPE